MFYINDDPLIKILNPDEIEPPDELPPEDIGSEHR